MPTEARKGCQTPSYCFHEKYDYTDMEDCVELAKAYATAPYEWQRNVLKHWLAKDKNGKFVHGECGLSVPRQNGKNELIVYRELIGLLIYEDRIVHTAHRVDTVGKAFRRLKQVFMNKQKFPELFEICKNGKGICNGKGYEAINCEWVTEDGKVHRSSIEFTSRANGANVGSDNISLLVVDEAQYYTSDQQSDIMPILSASKSDRQVIYTGTPPDHKTKGDRFKAFRKSVKNGKKKASCWHEWSTEEVGNKAEKERWYLTNPTLGHLISEDWIEKHELDYDDYVFAVQRLGYWSEDVAVGDIPINKKSWEECVTKTPPEDGVMCFSVKFDSRGENAAISVCLNSPTTKKRHIECVKYAPCKSVSWISDYLSPVVKKAAQIIIDGRARSADLMQKLNDLGAPKGCVYLATTNELISACSMLEGAIEDKEVTHINQPLLTNSVCECIRRPVGALGGWAWGDSLDVPSAVVESAALAYYASKKTKRNPNRKGRIF